VHNHWKSAGSYSTVGLEFALSVIFGLFAGQWLDERYSTGGWLTALGFGFGLAAGSRAIYRALERANREARREEQEAEEERRKYLDGNEPR
jgi:hypothetical protein